MCSNMEQAGAQAAENSGNLENSTETSAAETPSSFSSAGCTTLTIAVSSVARTCERIKVKCQKRPACVHDQDSKDNTIGEAIKKLAAKGEQMASVMEWMQDLQAQQLQSCPHLLAVLISIWKIRRGMKCLNNELNTQTII